MERFFKKSTTSMMPKLVDLEKLIRDPSKRKRLTDFNVNQHEEIRRNYLALGGISTLSLQV